MDTVACSRGLRIFQSGEETYSAMLDAMQGAKKSICLESYTVQEGETANRFAGILMDRANAGIEVNFMYDSFGSFELSGRFLRRLRDNGVRVLEYSPLFSKGLPRLSSLRLRNHRKTLTIDSEVGFIGGMNISDHFVSQENGKKGWRDTHLRMNGSAAISLEKMFLRTWTRSGGAQFTVDRYASQMQTARETHNPIFGNRGLYARKSIRNVYLHEIAKAKRSISISNAYFLPDSSMVRALRRAAHRGVRVTVLCGGIKSDVPLIAYASYPTYGKLLRHGVEIYEWQDSVLHAKTAVIDGHWLTIGSHNLNYRSFLNNLEANACFENPELASQMEEQFAQDLKTAKRIDYSDWEKRAGWRKVRDHFLHSLRFFL